MTRTDTSVEPVPAEIIAEGSEPIDRGTDDGGAASEMRAEEPESHGETDSVAVETDSVAVEADSVVAETTLEAKNDSDDLPLPAELDAVSLRRLIEALIFAADKPMSFLRLRQLTRVSDSARLQEALAELALEYRDRGIALHEVSGGYQFRTNTAFSPWVQQLIAGRPVRLSRAQLETLAIIAYRQPITRPEIDEIRGVDSSATLRLLLDRSLVRVLGKREEVGRPMLYGTTKEFLEFFSLGDLRELPTLREYSELTAESRQVVSERLGDAAGREVEAAGSEVKAAGLEVEAAGLEVEAAGSEVEAAGSEVEAAGLEHDFATLGDSGTDVMVPFDEPTE